MRRRKGELGRRLGQRWVLLDQRPLASDRPLGDVVDHDRDRARGRGADPLAAPALVDRRPRRRRSPTQIAAELADRRQAPSSPSRPAPGDPAFAEIAAAPGRRRRTPPARGGAGGGRAASALLRASQRAPASLFEHAARIRASSRGGQPTRLEGAPLDREATGTRASRSSPSTLKPVAPSVSTSTSRPLAVVDAALAPRSCRARMPVGVKRPGQPASRPRSRPRRGAPSRGIGVDLGAAAEGPGDRDGHLPGLAGEDLGAVAAHPARDRLRRSARRAARRSRRRADRAGA